MKKGSKILWVLSLLALVFEIFHQLAPISIVFKGYFYSMLWLIACIFMCPKLIARHNYFYFLVFFAFALLYWLRGGTYYHMGSFNHMIVLIIYYLVFPLIFFYFRDYCTKGQITTIMLVLFAVVTYTLIKTAPLAIAHPTLIRQIAVNPELDAQYMSTGMMSYALPHGIVPIIPALCYGIKYIKDKIIKILSVLLLIEIFALIFFSGATTPLLIYIMVLFVSFIYNLSKSFRANFRVIAFVVIVLLLITSKTVVLYFLDTISPLLEGTYFADKAEELKLVLSLNAGSAEDVQARGDLFSNTINTFWAHPLLGSTDSSQMGGHNYFFDILASIGLLGFIPFIANLFYIFRKSYYKLRPKIRGYYLIGISCFLFMALTKNVFGSDFFVFPIIVLPCLLMLYDEKQIQNS